MVHGYALRSTHGDCQVNRSPLGTSLNGQAERLEIDVAKRSWLFYPEYQQTAIPWLGAVPSHWEVRRLKSALAGR